MVNTKRFELKRSRPLIRSPPYTKLCLHCCSTYKHSTSDSNIFLKIDLTRSLALILFNLSHKYQVSKIKLSKVSSIFRFNFKGLLFEEKYNVKTFSTLFFQLFLSQSLFFFFLIFFLLS